MVTPEHVRCLALKLPNKISVHVVLLRTLDISELVLNYILPTLILMVILRYMPSQSAVFNY